MTERPTGHSATYMFLDESGNFDFSAKGSRYFILTCATMRRPFPMSDLFDDLKHRCIEDSRLPDLEYFHAANDNPAVRQEVFDCIAASLENIEIDSLIVDKSEIGPALQPSEVFYPQMLARLLERVIQRELRSNASEIIIVTDTLPIQRHRKAVTKGIQRAVRQMLPREYRYRIIHHASRAHYGLQLVDYCCWAINRKWERGDTRYYDVIRPAVRSEFGIAEATQLPEGQRSSEDSQTK